MAMCTCGHSDDDHRFDGEDDYQECKVEGCDCALFEEEEINEDNWDESPEESEEDICPDCDLPESECECE